jgi:hypothetical protein
MAYVRRGSAVRQIGTLNKSESSIRVETIFAGYSQNSTPINLGASRPSRGQKLGCVGYTAPFYALNTE